MYFVNRGNSSFLLLAIVVLGFIFLINFLPYILLIGAIVWSINYGHKKIKKWNFKSEPKVKSNKSSFNKSQREDFNNGNVIDVEYTEVK